MTFLVRIILKLVFWSALVALANYLFRVWQDKSVFRQWAKGTFSKTYTERTALASQASASVIQKIAGFNVYRIMLYVCGAVLAFSIFMSAYSFLKGKVTQVREKTMREEMIGLSNQVGTLTTVSELCVRDSKAWSDRATALEAELTKTSDACAIESMRAAKRAEARTAAKLKTEAKGATNANTSESERVDPAEWLRGLAQPESYQGDDPAPAPGDQGGSADSLPR